MKTFTKILKWVGIILLLLIAISFFLPSKVHIERSTTVGAPAEVIFTQVNDFKNWKNWSPWYKRDTAMKMQYSTVTAGVGAAYSWDSEHPKVGKGSMKIIESKPFETVATELNIGAGGISKARFKMENMGDSTHVIWSLDGDGKGIPWYMVPMSKYFNLAMDGMLGPDFEAGLKDIKSVTENMPGQ